jgi:hypothetical protein
MLFVASQTQGGSKFVQEFSDRLLGESNFQKTTVMSVTHEKSAIKFEDQSFANLPFLVSV